MHIKLSVSLDEKTIAEIQKIVDGDVYRSKSHLIEHAVREFLRRK